MSDPSDIDDTVLAGEEIDEPLIYVGSVSKTTQGGWGPKVEGAPFPWRT